MEFPRGVWRLAFESACMGDLPSCPRPGDRVSTVYVRDIAEGPSASIRGFRTGSEWCEDFELDRQVYWRPWVGDAAGVTWSLTAARGQCPRTDDALRRPGVGRRPRRRALAWRHDPRQRLW